MTAGTHRAIIDEATALLAEVGVRGATLRKIGARSGVNFAQLATRYGGKDRLLAACFSDVVDRDLAQFAAMAEEFARGGTGNPAPFLWAMCEDAGGRRRADNLVLTELILASTQFELKGIFRRWLVNRHEILRTMAAAASIDPLVLDTLGAILLMECSFAVSNYDAVSYRILARSGFNEAFELLSGRSLAVDHKELRGLEALYYIDLGDPSPMKQSGELGSTAHRKHMIVDAAAAILQEEGLDQLTNRAVAKRAGVSLALTTYHFPSINELVLAGLRRAVEHVASSLQPAATRQEIRNGMLAHRRRPSQAPEGDLRIHRGLLHISLAAARSPGEEHLGHLVRRQLGMLAYAAVDEEKLDISVTRTTATSYALWSAAAYLIARAFPNDDEPFDFDAQAELAGRCLLGFA